MPDADNEESEEAAGAGLQMLDAAGDDDAAHPDASEPEAPAEGIAESEFSESPGDEFLQSAVSEESDDMSAVEESAEANPAEDSYDASDYAGESAHQDFEGSWMDDGDYEGSAEMDEDPSNDIQAANNRLVDSWNPRETPRRERMQEKGLVLLFTLEIFTLVRTIIFVDVKAEVQSRGIVLICLLRANFLA